MRITHVIEASGGGAGRQVRLLAMAQRASGHEVSLIISQRRGDPDFDQQIRDVREVGCEVVDIPMARNPSIGDLAVVREIQGWLRAHQIEVVHTHCAKAGLVGRVAAGPLRRSQGTKVFHTPHSWYLHGLSGTGRGLGWRLERWLARKTDGFICVSEDEIADGNGWHLFGKTPTYLALNGLPTGFAEQAMSRQGARNALGIEPANQVIGAFTRLDRRKGLAGLLDAFAALPGIPRLVLVGDGGESEALHRRAQGLGITDRVDFLGYRADAGHCVRALDVAVLPSEWEGRSLFALEALACGVRLVATNAPGNRFVVDYGGRLVASNRAAVLSAAIAAELEKAPLIASDLPTVADQAERLIGIYQQKL